MISEVRKLWAKNSMQLREGEDTTQSGAALMGMTDTSPARCRRSNEECADRVEAERQKSKVG